MLPTNQKMCYTVAELAELLPLGRNSIYKLVNRSDFPKIKVGRKILIPVRSLMKWMEGNGFLESI